MKRLLIFFLLSSSAFAAPRDYKLYPPIIPHFHAIKVTPLIFPQVNTFCAANLACTVTGAWTFQANNTFTGSNTFNGAGISGNCTIINKIRCVSEGNPQGWAGSDFGAWVNAAIQSLPVAPTGGEIEVGCPSTGNFVYTTTILIDREVHLHATGVGTQGNGGCLFIYNGSGMGIQVYGVGAFGGATGSLLENFSIANTGTGTVGIDIDQGVYGVTLRGVTDQPGTAWSTAFIRVGNTLTGGQVTMTTLDHVWVHGEPHGLVSLRNYGLNILGGSVFDQSGMQFGDATHLTAAAAIFGGVYTGAANTTVMTVLNSQSLNIYGADMEIDGTGYAVDCPSTATACGSITYHGGRVATASFSNQNTYIFDNNHGGTSWDIRNVITLGLGAGTFIFRNQAAVPQIVLLVGLITDTTGPTDTNAYTNVISYGHNFGGTLLPTSHWKGSQQCDGVVASGGCLWTLNDTAGVRTTILRSPDTVNNGQVGTTSGSQFELIAGGNIHQRINSTDLTTQFFGAPVPNVAGTIDLGTTLLPFGNLWLGTAATNNFKFAPAATAAARTINIPDPTLTTTLGLSYNATIGYYVSKKGTAGCTTAASIGGICATPITVTWGVTLPNTNYSVVCTPVGAPTSTPSNPYAITKSATTVTVNYFAIQAVAASWPAIDCMAILD